MKYFFYSVIFRTIPLFLFCLSFTTVYSQEKSRSYLIYNAQIIDVVEGKIKKENAVLIDGDKIKAVGDFATLSKNVPSSNQLNAGNKFLIPGLWDMHIHLEGQDLIEDNKALLPLFFTYGITTVRDCASDLGEQVLAWRDEINSGKLIGPKLFTAGLKLEGINSIWKGDLEISNEVELDQMLDKLSKWEVDFVKITENALRGPLFLKSVKAAHARGFLVSGHVPIELTIAELVEAGFSSVEHSSYLLRLGCDEGDIVADLKAGKITNAEANTLYQSTFDQQRAIKGYEAMAKKGLAVTPTLVGGKKLAYYDESNYLQDSMMTKYLTQLYTNSYQWRLDRLAKETTQQKADRKKRYELGASQVPYMQRAGIMILAGSDAAALNSFVYPGESLISELMLYQEAGMKPADILRSATINGARFLKQSDKMGTIDAGKMADLVLLEQNPLLDIRAVRNVIGVYTKSTYYNRAALNQLLVNANNAKLNLDKKRAVAK